MEDVQAKGCSSKSVVLLDSERQRCEVWTRVMGYHRPVTSFNIGKKAEFAERKFFKEKECYGSNRGDALARAA